MLEKTESSLAFSISMIGFRMFALFVSKMHPFCTFRPRHQEREGKGGELVGIQHQNVIVVVGGLGMQRRDEWE